MNVTVEYKREHRTWTEMWRRCTKSHRSEYKNYGGRGIKVCDKWKDFRVFLADMGRRPAGTSLDRIDNSGDYTPSNCRWATPVEQSRNKRQIDYSSRDYVVLSMRKDGATLWDIADTFGYKSAATVEWILAHCKKTELIKEIK